MPDPFCSECIRLQRENSELGERLNQMIEDEEHLDVPALIKTLEELRKGTMDKHTNFRSDRAEGIHDGIDRAIREVKKWAGL